jgi:hypothetical protein
MPPTGVDAGVARPTWRETEVVLTVDPSYLALPNAKVALEGALRAWTSVVDQLPKVSIRYADGVLGKQSAEQNRTDHRIFFAPEGDYRAKGALAVTLLTSDENLNTIIDADILVNGGHRFADTGATDRDQTDNQTYDLQNVLAHEFGHWFGLDENYANREATMYAYVYPGETKKRSLEDCDIDAAQLAYSQADNPNAESSGCGVARNTSHGSGTLFLCLAGWLLWRGRPNRSAKPHLLTAYGRLHS